MKTRQNLIADQKRECRRQVKQLLKELSVSYIDEASAVIRDKVTELPEYMAAQTIMCYLSYGKEVQTQELIEHMWANGKKVCIPLCTDTANHIMEAKLYTRETRLVSGAYGIMEPTSYDPTIPPDEVDMIIVPCVSADRTGRRLGHGAGYYDRYMAQTDATRVVICFRRAMLDEVPVDEYDLPADVLITE